MSDRVLVGTGKGLIRIERFGDGRWEIARTWFAGDPVSMLLPEPDGRRIHAALDLGHFGVKMQRSEDAGETWSEVSTHPSDPDIVWFVPAKKDEQRIPVDARLVVTRTRDGGEHFDVLTNGLPDEPAWDLVYRHALDVSGDGNRLAFGSTTGSLWVSEDQGDSWQVVSEHLPPVACVRFES